uniref:Kazal-like domain-containing protein n=1 Tax=Globisporangium ultimum (strain ATCC 200006 / CBS 805.95 / DAOM BR144) TaxID=431595 RepID=K3XAT6_GLOUD
MKVMKVASIRPFVLASAVVALLHGVGAAQAQGPPPVDCTLLTECPADPDPSESVCGDDYNAYPSACSLLLTHCQHPGAVGPYPLEGAVPPTCLGELLGDTFGFDVPDFGDDVWSDPNSVMPTAGGFVMITDTAPHALDFIPKPTSSDNSDEADSSNSSSSSSSDEDSEDEGSNGSEEDSESNEDNGDASSHDLDESLGDGSGEHNDDSSRPTGLQWPAFPWGPAPGTDGYDPCAFVCPMFYAPVCTDDGHVYENKCVYASARCRDTALTEANADNCPK